MTNELIAQLSHIRDQMLELEKRYISTSGGAHPSYSESQRNLLHYLALRSADLRPLQHELAVLGLSSLGRMESHVLASIETVLSVLRRLAGQAHDGGLHLSCSEFQTGARLLNMHTEDLLGPTPAHRSVRIMVTLPSEAQADYTLIHSLLQQGMEIARINCAHDGPAVWERMIRHIRRAEKALSKSCRVLMDLGGPKLRTGAIQEGLSVVKLRPQRNELGIVIHPARIWLSAAGKSIPSPASADATLPVPKQWLLKLRIQDQIKFKDVRGAGRTMTVVDSTEEGCWAEIRNTAYMRPGISLKRRSSKSKPWDRAAIGSFPSAPGAIDLAVGDILILTRQLRPGRRATRDSAGQVLTPASISCTLPAIFDDVQTGESIWFDDGKIAGIIENVEKDYIFVRITQAKVTGEKLRSDKGINLPDSDLKLPALTDKDLDDLTFVATHADMVGLSFAQNSTDVEMLIDRLNRLGRNDLAVVLKIETRRGFDQLPSMLLAGMKAPSLGVMIARGDLAVECGFERLAEVQEEMLWICEAAHCPVIWATQVLENLAKDGIPSRAEITDAAMGHRAEAVMLNKGPHIVRAVQMLDDILQRMEAHQLKKQSMMRELHLAQNFMQNTAALNEQTAARVA